SGSGSAGSHFGSAIPLSSFRRQQQVCYLPPWSPPASFVETALPANDQVQQRGRLCGLHTSERADAGSVCCNGGGGGVLFDPPPLADRPPDLSMPAGTSHTSRTGGESFSRAVPHGHTRRRPSR